MLPTQSHVYLLCSCAYRNSYFNQSNRGVSLHLDKLRHYMVSSRSWRQGSLLYQPRREFLYLYSNDWSSALFRLQVIPERHILRPRRNGKARNPTRNDTRGRTRTHKPSSQKVSSFTGVLLDPVSSLHKLSSCWSMDDVSLYI